VAAVEDVIVEAHESAQATRGSVLSVVGGFVLFTLVSAGWARTDLRRSLEKRP
jgi:ZIP family zinc transporter